MAIVSVIANNGALSIPKASFLSSAGVDRIGGIPPTGDALDALHRIGTKVRFARDMTIFNDGDPVEYCYKIVSGAVRLCKHTWNGKRQIAEFLLPGDYFGFWQFGRYSFTAEAVSDAVMTAYPQQQVERLAQTMPSMGRRLLVLMSERLGSMQDHLVMLGRQAAKERVASFLILLADRMGAEEGEVFDIPMNRQDMADYLGLTVETVCRALSELKRTRLISAPSVHEAVINNMDALQNVVDNED
jgi:CRP-like cAMP-binding protein